MHAICGTDSASFADEAVLPSCSKTPSSVRATCGQVMEREEVSDEVSKYDREMVCNHDEREYNQLPTMK